MSEEQEPVGKMEVTSTRTFKLYKKTCPVCGTEFEGTKRRIYDRPACAVKAHEQRNAEKVRERNREAVRRYAAKNPRRKKSGGEQA